MNETFYSKMTDFFDQRDAKLVPEDPWIREIYANENNCSWKSSEETECQAMESYQPLMEFSIPQNFGSQKIHKPSRRDCKSIAVGDKKELRKCVKENLVPNMKFTANSGTIKIKLDENGDAFARWRIYQNQNGNSVLVATYDETEDPKLQLYTEQIDWSVFISANKF